MNDYRQKVYAKYVSAFKGTASTHADYEFSDRKLLPILKPWLNTIDRRVCCVDLGCGHGNILHALKTLGFERCEGVDVSEEQVSIARRVTPDVSTENIFEYLQRQPMGKFGVVTLFDVIEHLTKSEILTLLGLIVSRMSNGGILIVHCPNGSSPMAAAVFASDFTHETLLNPSSAEVACRVSGLKGFQCTEHLGASSGPLGLLRRGLWRVMRWILQIYNIIETGSGGDRIFTRNFAFMAVK